MASCAPKSAFPAVRLALCGLLAAGSLPACHTESSGPGEGAVRFAAVISAVSPSMVDTITVTVTSMDNGAWSGIVQNLNQGPDGWSGTISSIEAGNDTFAVAAFYMGNEVYSGSANQFITDGVTSSVTVVLSQDTPNAPFSENAPIITSVTASSVSVNPGQPVTLSAVTMITNAGDFVTYTWGDGTSPSDFSNINSSSPIWTAPACPGTYTITVWVTNSFGDIVDATVSISDELGNDNDGGTTYNSWPEITLLGSMPDLVAPGGTSAMAFTTTPAYDGNPLTYSWTESSNCSDAYFNDPTLQEPVWTAPPLQPMGACDLTVVAYDDLGGFATGTIVVNITSNQNACNVPIIYGEVQPNPSMSLDTTQPLSIEAMDPMSEMLSYEWNVSPGLQLTGSGDSVSVLTTIPESVYYAVVTVVNTDLLQATYIFTIDPGPPFLDAIGVWPDNDFNLVPGDTMQFTSIGSFSDTSMMDVSNITVWSSDTPSVATVNSSGLVTAVSSGSANITGSIGNISGSWGLLVMGSLSAPNSVAGGPINYVWSQWGTTSDPTPSAAITGGAGSMDYNVGIVAYDGANPMTANLLGYSGGNMDGSFGSINLSETNVQVVYLFEYSGGNTYSSGAQTRNVFWTATLNGKVSGSPSPNPNAVIANPAEFLFYNQPNGGGDNGDNIYGAITSIPGQQAEVPSYPPPVTSFAQTWVNQGPSSVPTQRQLPAYAFDTARGVGVMFGGYSGSSNLGDTWEWNGSVWNQITTANSPSGRQGSAMAYDSLRGVMVLFGGYDGSDENDTWTYDGTNWYPQSPSNAPSPRDGHMMVYDQQNEVTILFGGYAVSAYSYETWLWDGTNWALQSPGNSPTARYRSGMVYERGSGLTVLFGGFDGLDENDTWDWDGSNWNYATNSGPSPRDTMMMCFDEDYQYAVLFGGEANAGSSIFSDTWTVAGTTSYVAASAPVGRYGSAMFCNPTTHQVTVFGGVDLMLGSEAQDTWQLDLQQGVWHAAATSSPAARDYPAMAFDSNQNQTVLFSGNGMSGDLTDTWQLDGTTGWQFKTISGPSARHAAAMDYDSANNLTVLFGGNSGGTPQNDTWQWNGSSWTPESPVGPPAMRFGHSMAYDSGHGKSFIFGGCGHVTGGMCDVYLNDIWEWDAGMLTWTNMTPCGTNPPPLVGTSMAYDSNRGVIVVFGGYDSTLTDYNQVWEWDAGMLTWTNVTPSSGPQPSPRDNAAMAFDSTLGLTMMYGGLTVGGGVDSDTWSWNGTTWSFYTPALGPTELGAAAMVYDSNQQGLVLFGGFYGSLSGSTYTFASGVTEVPMQIAQVDFAATGETDFTASLQSITFSATAGGVGYTSEPGNVEVDGASMLIWNPNFGGSWLELANNSANSSCAAALSYNTMNAGEAQGYLLGGSFNSIYLAFVPNEQTGGGPIPGSIDLTGYQVTVNYQR